MQSFPSNSQCFWNAVFSLEFPVPMLHRIQSTNMKSNSYFGCQIQNAHYFTCKGIVVKLGWANISSDVQCLTGPGSCMDMGTEAMERKIP